MPHRDRVKGPTKALKGGDRSTAVIAEALHRASAAMDRRRPDEAERIARDVLAKNPQQPRGLHVLGISLMAQGRPQEAVTALEQAARLLRDPVIDVHLGIALRQVGRVAD